MNVESIPRYPLAWPLGWPRTRVRRTANFNETVRTSTQYGVHSGRGRQHGRRGRRLEH